MQHCGRLRRDGLKLNEAINRHFAPVMSMNNMHMALLYVHCPPEVQLESEFWKITESCSIGVQQPSLYAVLATASLSGMTPHLPVVMCVLQKGQIHSQVLILPAMQQLLDRRIAMQGVSQAGHAICD